MNEKGVSGKEMAEKTGVSSQSIYNIVNGTHFPKPELLKAIADVLDIDVREMFIETKESSQTSLDIISNIERKVSEIGDQLQKLKEII